MYSQSPHGAEQKFLIYWISQVRECGGGENPGGPSSSPPGAMGPSACLQLHPSMKARMSLPAPHGSQRRLSCRHKLTSQARREKYTLGNPEDLLSTNGRANDTRPCMHPRFGVTILVVDACEGPCVCEPFNTMKSDGVAAKKDQAMTKGAETIAVLDGGARTGVRVQVSVHLDLVLAQPPPSWLGGEGRPETGWPVLHEIYGGRNGPVPRAAKGHQREPCV